MSSVIEELNEPSAESKDKYDFCDVDQSDTIDFNNWEYQLHDWEQMLKNKKVARLEDEEKKCDGYNDMEDDLLSNYKHPP
ncbi:25215_t:CDS:2, partial [Gigaspora rosea]